MDDERARKRNQVRKILLTQRESKQRDNQVRDKMQRSSKVIINLNNEINENTENTGANAANEAKDKTRDTKCETPTWRTKPVPTATPPPKPSQSATRSTKQTQSRKPEKLTNLLNFLEEVDSAHEELSARTLSLTSLISSNTDHHNQVSSSHSKDDSSREGSCDTPTFAPNEQKVDYQKSYSKNVASTTAPSFSSPKQSSRRLKSESIASQQSDGAVSLPLMNDVQSCTPRSRQSSYCGDEIKNWKDNASNGGFSHGGMLSQRSTSTLLSLELDNKDKLVRGLKKALVACRRERDDMKLEHASTVEQKLKEQKQVHDITVKRQLGFIEKLVEDKKALASKVEELSKRLSKQDVDHKSKLEALVQQHEKDLVKMKENTLNAEKGKRQQWQQKKIEEIKQSTIRGLEPEMQRILQKSREDRLEIESRFQTKLQRQLETSESDKHEALKGARLNAEKELKAAVQQEHERMQRLITASDDRNLVQLEQLRNRLERELNDRNKRHEEVIENLTEEHNKAIDGERQRAAEALAECQRRYAMEMNSKQECFEIEKQEWQTRISSQLRKKFESEHAKHKGMLNKERDQKLKRIVAKLNEEQLDEMKRVKEEHDSLMENGLRKYRLEIESLKDELDEWRHKFETQKAFKEDSTRVVEEAQDRIVDLEEQLHDKENRIAQLTKKLSQVDETITEEVSNAKQTLVSKQKTLLAKISQLEDQNSEKDVQIAKFERMMNQQAQMIQNEKEAEFAELHQRVQLTISKKDETIELLSKRHLEAEQRAEHLEELLERQREELLEEL